MIAFCIALLVAGSNAAELRGVEQESQKTGYFKLKNTKHGLTKEIFSKVVKSETSVKTQATGNVPFVDEPNRGYLMEWTRVNTDCSGRVEFVGGVLTGSTNPIAAEGGILTLSFATTINQDTYALNPYISNNPDGALSEQAFSIAGDRCSTEIGEMIPYDGGLVYDHKGYFFGHTFMKGDYSAVTASLKGLYTEMYTTLNDCVLGVQPVMFAVPWVKGECYFDSNKVLNEGEEAPKHNWVKIVGFGKDFMEYSIHNNAECENKEAPYKKSPVMKDMAPEGIFDCTQQETGLLGLGWVKYKTYN